MPKFVDSQGNLTSTIPKLESCEKLSSINLFYDTEFTVKDSLDILSIQVKAAPLTDFAIVYDKSELTTNFNPWLTPLQTLGYEISVMNQTDFGFFCFDIESKFNELIEGIRSASKIRKEVERSIDAGQFDEILEACGLSRENIKYVRSNGKSSLNPCFNKLTFQSFAHFSEADLGKCVGRDWQHILLDSELESRRTIKTRIGVTKSGASYKKPITFPTPVRIDGNWYECAIELRDTMHRIPVLSGKGLDNQCKVYQASIPKLDVETDEIAGKIGLNNPKEVKSNMDIFRQSLPDLFAQYGALDVHATEALSNKTLELLNQVRAEFGLPETTIEQVNDTAGSNISAFLKDLINQHFGDSATVTTKLNNATVKQFQELEHNQYGFQPLQTVGGLLYSRMSRFPHLDGVFGDLDESSCYATALSSMSLYIGSPVIHTFRGKKRPKLADVIELMERICYRDSWVVRVSGKFKEAINTLLLSNLKFTPKRLKLKTVFDKRESSKSIEKWNAYKIGNSGAESTILTKECEFALLNAELLDCIKLLPESWQLEYFDLSVDVFCFFPKELCCESVSELESKSEKYPDDGVTPSIDYESGELNLKIGYSRKNLCLRFPIDEYYQKLKEIRAGYKRAKNPIQEVFKLVLNSTYGALACENLPVNNLLAANQITASARATSWLMMNSLNGFQVITDGCTFSWEHFPLGQTFKSILTRNPEYLIDFDPTIQSGIFDKIPQEKLESDCQRWIDESFIDHMRSFYESDCRAISRYSFELKDCDYPLKDGEKLKGIRTFTTFINHGSGSYVKGYQGSLTLFDGVSYNLSEPTFTKVKARSFKGADKALLDWYVDTFVNGYKEPFIYQERELIKFGAGNDIAIRFLESGDCDEIIHPMGLSVERFKLMKLITRSQFLFQNKKQLRNFERNQESKLSPISKWILTNTFWDMLKGKRLSRFDAELRESIDYASIAKSSPIGIGWEMLSLMPKYNGDLALVRQSIADVIARGKSNFNAALHLERQIDRAIVFADVFAAVIVKKANALDDLKQICKKSIDNNPTALVVEKSNIKRLYQLMEESN